MDDENELKNKEVKDRLSKIHSVNLSFKLGQLNYMNNKDSIFLTSIESIISHLEDPVCYLGDQYRPKSDGYPAEGYPTNPLHVFGGYNGIRVHFEMDEPNSPSGYRLTGAVKNKDCSVEDPFLSWITMPLRISVAGCDEPKLRINPLKDPIPGHSSCRYDEERKVLRQILSGLLDAAAKNYWTIPIPIDNLGDD